jgi:hypothetical protein
VPGHSSLMRPLHVVQLHTPAAHIVHSCKQCTVQVTNRLSCCFDGYHAHSIDSCLSDRLHLSADISTGDIDKPEREAAYDPNKVPGVPKPAEKLKKQSNISLTELPSGPEEGPGHSLSTALKAGATRAVSTDMQHGKSHSDTAMMNSKALSPTGPDDAEDVARDMLQSNAVSVPSCVPKAAEHDRALASVTAPEA